MTKGVKMNVLTKNKHLEKCIDKRGLILATAIDHFETIKKMISVIRGSNATSKDLANIKKSITKCLSPISTAILLDPDIGHQAIDLLNPDTGLILAYETPKPYSFKNERMPRLRSSWSVKRLLESRCNGIKVMLEYDPYASKGVNEKKISIIERIGYECLGNNVPFFFEPVYYDSSGFLNDFEIAKRKPGAVIKTINQFSSNGFPIDIMKVEFPFELKYVKGSSLYLRKMAYTTSNAVNFLREASDAAERPFIFLSGGVPINGFLEMLNYAAQAKSKFSGVLCGRAIWQDGIKFYEKSGVEGFEDWLNNTASLNIDKIRNLVQKHAFPIIV